MCPGRDGGAFLAYRAGVVAFVGSEELVAVVELHDLIGDPDVDVVSGGGGAEADLLPVDADHAHGRGAAGHPGAVRAVRTWAFGQVSGRPQRGDPGRRGLQEPARGGGHVQRLVRPAAVVVGDPFVQLDLRHGQRGEHAVGAELGADRPVEPLDLAGSRGRAWPGEQVLDAVLAADPVEQRLDRRLVEPAGEDLAVEFLSDVKGFGWSS